MEKRRRSGYPSDVSDEEWAAFVAPYLTLCREDAGQRGYPLRAVCVVRSGIAWRMMPNDLPPWHVVYQQMRRWMDAGCFQMLVADLRLLPRRWVVERSFAWAARFRRLARDYQRLAKTLAAVHFLAFACIMLANLFRLIAGSS